MIGRAFGVVLMAVALWDVFITVLYARAKGGIVARTVSHLTWHMFRVLAQMFPRRQARILSFCGPAVLIVLVAAWALSLTLASALIMQPALGEGIRSTSGESSADFITAMYAAGGSLAIVGASGFTPHDHAWKLYFLFNSLVGASVISLTLTYLMQVYSALLRRNSLALTMYLLTNETDDAAELICGLGPRSDFQTGATTLADLSTQMAAIKETHHFYPVLFYFRFQETFYSVSHMTLMALDIVTLIKTALDNERHAVLKASGSLHQLSKSALKLVTTLNETFLSRGALSQNAPDDAARERWGQRYLDALRRFQNAGIVVTSDEQAGLAAYVRSRSHWDPVVMALAPAMKHDPSQVDPAGTHAA